MFYKARRSPTPWRPLLKGSNLFLMQKQLFKHFTRGLQGVGDLLTFKNPEFFDLAKDPEGFLCPGITILGIIFTVNTHFGTSN